MTKYTKEEKLAAYFLLIYLLNLVLSGFDNRIIVL